MPATRRRSWLIAVAATMVGLAFYYYEDLLDESHIPSGIHTAVEAVEFVLLGPGMGVLAFILCEYLRIVQDKLRSERERAQQQRFLILGRIAASVAHEVRNPLHNIRLLIDEMHHSGSMPADQPLCQRVEANLERINRAVELVYQLAKPTTVTTQVDIGVDLVAITREALDAETARSGLRIEATLPATPAPVACPAATLRIVLDNLLRNAVAAGGVVRCEVVPGNGIWQAVIRNRGDLPAEVLGEGTDEAHDSAKAGGLGLGLFISRQLLRSVGGGLVLAQQGDEVEARVCLPRWTEGT
ncbi:MAG: HAMP domain-containing histidine kinase [Planctomycetes bacterium]|nr:HAMP domain-containing histidine kinase [Planctomycetota bacterium]